MDSDRGGILALNYTISFTPSSALSIFDLSLFCFITPPLPILFVPFFVVCGKHQASILSTRFRWINTNRTVSSLLFSSLFYFMKNSTPRGQCNPKHRPPLALRSLALHTSFSLLHILTLSPSLSCTSWRSLHLSLHLSLFQKSIQSVYHNWHNEKVNSQKIESNNELFWRRWRGRGSKARSSFCWWAPSRMLPCVCVCVIVWLCCLIRISQQKPFTLLTQLQWLPCQYYTKICSEHIMKIWRLNEEKDTPNSLDCVSRVCVCAPPY